MIQKINEGMVEFSVSVVDESKRLVFGEVYAPNKIDAFGWFMEPSEVEKMAHRFMRLNLNSVIDTNHDNVPNGSYPVQSFIAREGDTQFTTGAWVLAVKVTDDKLWNSIVKGEINAFSMEIYVKKVPATVEYEIVAKQVGHTEPAGEDQHTHYFYAEVDSNGRVVKGKTSTDAGHSHEIDVNSVTQATNNHAHRFFVGK